MKNQYSSFLSSFKKYINSAIILAAIFQIIFCFDLMNFYGVIVIIVCWVIYSETIFNFKTFFKYPLSSLLILGYVVSQYLFPLFFTSLELKKIIYNLKVPIQVFTHSFLTLLALILAHLTYTNFRKSNKNTKISLLLLRHNFFKTPSSYQLWIMGYLGLIAMFFIYFYLPSQGSQSEGFVQKLIQGLIFFTYAPFFIVVNNLISKTHTSKNTYIQIGLFVLLLFLVSLGANARGAFMFGFAGLGFAFLLFGILEVIKFKILSKRTVILGIVIFYFLTGPLSDIATAMVLVRGQRKDISRSELVYKTLEVYQNKDLINKTNNLLENDGNYGFSDWDERYINNRFASRFCNLKFNDNSLYLSNKIGNNNIVLRNFDLDKVISVLPEPLLNLLGISIDKVDINSKSRGDVLYSLSGAPKSVLGGFRVGHFSGIGMVSYGWFYLILIYILFIPLFYLLDSFAIRSTKGYLIISFAILIKLKFVFMYLPYESVTANLNYFIRGWIESLFLYTIIFKITSYKWSQKEV